MTTRSMDGPESLWRLKVVRQHTGPNPEYTGYGCGVTPYVVTGGTFTRYYGPYVRRHAAMSMMGKEGHGHYVVSAEIESCQPEWIPVQKPEEF